MPDRAYIVSRTLETKIAMAENDGDHALIVTLDALKEILTTLKEQDEQIKTLSAFAKADGIDVDALLGRSVKR